ncbi:MAG: hypothetical protein RG741_01350 [Bacteroidales bacterium]|nr:hypothetical protein [Bacteroidales bacterium]
MAGEQPSATARVAGTAKSPIKKISLRINEQKSAQEADATAAHDTALPPGKAFSYEAFLASWNKIALGYKTDSLGLFLAMTKNKPVTVRDGAFQITVDNAIQADLVQEKKAEILGRLRKDLGNYSIDFTTTISKKKKADKAYLPKEKLDRIIEKNKAVEQLKNLFGLELDY